MAVGTTRALELFSLGKLGDCVVLHDMCAVYQLYPSSVMFRFKLRTVQQLCHGLQISTHHFERLVVALLEFSSWSRG